MDIGQLKTDVAAGKLSQDKLLVLIVAQQKRIAELEELIKGKNPTARVDDPYSIKAEELRKRKAKLAKQTAKRKGSKNGSKKIRRGRVTTADKVALAARTELVYPVGETADNCQLSHTRVAWRLESGRAVLVAYEIYRCGNKYGKPAGILGRSEFGIEIFIALAYQVYCLGLSIDKACKVLSFFEQLKIRKSQADALLNQLSRAWENEFDCLCTLLANSAVVHCDETSWSINSVWAFLNEKLTVLFYGVHKDGDTLAQILNKETFAGVLVSDDAAVYQDFDQSQKCWAHLIRKAIKLTLQDPQNREYRKLADGLLDVYRQAKRIKADKRLLDSTRCARVGELDDQLLDLCAARWIDEDTSGTEVENDYRRLCNEVMRLMLDKELFVFVTKPEVDGTNNAAERQLRDDAMARKTGRTSKTPNGAKRRSIISSVLQSIGKNIGTFTLSAVIGEVQRWLEIGESSFAAQVQKLKARTQDPRPPNPASETTAKSLLDRVVLSADS
jgi:transposase